MPVKSAIYLAWLVGVSGVLELKYFLHLSVNGHDAGAVELCVAVSSLEPVVTTDSLLRPLVTASPDNARLSLVQGLGTGDTVTLLIGGDTAVTLVTSSDWLLWHCDTSSRSHWSQHTHLISPNSEKIFDICAVNSWVDNCLHKPSTAAVPSVSWVCADSFPILLCPAGLNLIIVSRGTHCTM